MLCASAHTHRHTHTPLVRNYVRGLHAPVNGEIFLGGIDYRCLKGSWPPPLPTLRHCRHECHLPSLPCGRRLPSRWRTNKKCSRVKGQYSLVPTAGAAQMTGSPLFNGISGSADEKTANKAAEACPQMRPQRTSAATRSLTTSCLSVREGHPDFSEGPCGAGRWQAPRTSHRGHHRKGHTHTCSPQVPKSGVTACV